MKNKILFTALAIGMMHSASGQTLEKMNWFNEPEQWQIEGGKLSMMVTPHTDYWRR